MALTQVEELLIDYLRTSKAEKSTGVIVMLQLKERSKQLEMCQFLSDNPEATDEEIAAASNRIARN